MSIFIRKILSEGTASQLKVEKFLNALTSYFSKGENNGEYMIGNKVTVNLQQSQDMILINTIDSYEKGGGNLALKALCELADKYKVTLTLLPLAYGKKNIDTDALIQWYQRNGFDLVNKYMFRLPKN